jgi:spermidine synthase
MGGGTFERFFSAVLPELSVTSVEHDPAVIHLARAFFSIPPEAPVVNESALGFLSRRPGRFDVILCDLHSGVDAPAFLAQPAFYEAACGCLSESGMMVTNLLPSSQQALLDILLAMRHSFKWIWLLDFPDHRNIVLFSLNGAPPEDEILKQRAQALEDRTGLSVMDILSRLKPLPEKQTTGATQDS